MKYYSVGISFFLLSAGASILWLWTIKASFVPYLPGFPDLNGADQFIFANPLSFTRMLFANLLKYGSTYVGQAIGLRLGWLGTKLPVAFVAAYALVIVITAVTNGRSISRGQRMILGGVALAETLLVISSMFPETEPGKLFDTRVARKILHTAYGAIRVPAHHNEIP